MPAILLIQPPLQDFYFTAKRSFPYGLASIAAQLEEGGFSVDILDALATSKARVRDWPAFLNYLKPYYSEADLSPFALFAQWRHFGYSHAWIRERLRASGAFLVGISALFTAYSEQALMMATLAKQALPQCRTVVGGHHATQLPEAVMANPHVDFVIRGDGEEAMTSLATALRQNLGLDHVPGLVCRRPDGTLMINPPAVVTNLNRLRLPALEHVNLKYYRRGQHNSAVIVTSRGCPLTCTYCATGRLSGIPYRRRSLNAVMCEIQRVVETHQVRFIDFEDENLSLERQWFQGLLIQMIQRYGAAHLELRAMNGLMPDTLNGETLNLMQQAGFKTINMALGTTHSRQLKRFGRPDVREAFDVALNACVRLGVAAVGYILIAGPQQSAAESVDDLLFLAQRPVLAALSPFYPAPGSADWELLKAQNRLPAEPGLLRGSVLPLELNTSRLETVTLLRLGRILNFIKYLHQQKIELPAPSAVGHDHIAAPANRAKSGRILLGMFLRDGRIYGVAPSGRIIEHATALTVSRRFLEGLAQIKTLS